MFASPGAIALELGPLGIRWYGVLVAAAIVAGLWLLGRRAAASGLAPDPVVMAAQWAVLAGLAGARAWQVAFDWSYYGRHPSKILAIWEGGLAIHGGLLVGPLVAVLLLRRAGVAAGPAFDAAAPCLALGQAIGRWGNFFNEEAFGRPTALPWKLYISPGHRPPGLLRDEFFHPTFLYESLWDLAIALALLCWGRRLAARPGAAFFAYLALYSVGRFAIEGLRMDSFWVGGIRVAQAASVAGLAIALAGLAWARRAPSGARP